ncbi:MAG: cell division protein FtsQ/DivIB [Neisseriaceae bacterium]
MFGSVKFINRLSFLIGAAAIFILAVSFVYYVLNHWFKIDKIIVRGNVSNLTHQELSDIIKNRLKGTFFTLNIDIIQKEFEQIPWVQSVHVVREFPDTIMVNVVEYQAIANLGHGKLLSVEKLIFNGDDPESSLPVFTVPFNQINEALKVYSSIQPFIEFHKLVLKSMVYNGVGMTKLGFSNGMTVVICGMPVSGKLQLLDKYWTQLYSIESNITSVNMCYKNALAIK